MSPSRCAPLQRSASAGTASRNRVSTQYEPGSPARTACSASATSSTATFSPRSRRAPTSSRLYTVPPVFGPASSGTTKRCAAVWLASGLRVIEVAVEEHVAAEREAAHARPERGVEPIDARQLHARPSLPQKNRAHGEVQAVE